MFDAKFFSRNTRSPGQTRALAIALLFSGLALAATTGGAAPLGDADAIPQVDDAAREGYINYVYANKHKAYAIAPGGAWAWVAETASAQEAETQALQRCRSSTRQKCVLYALNNERVFDADQWPRLWGPYANRADAETAPIGTRVGERFFDLAYTDADGKPRSISSSRGKVVFVHFWGPWCTPCLRELPSLKHFYRQLAEQMPGQVEMVLLQVRAAFNDSQQWIEDNDFAELPLADSGVTCVEQTTLSLADGGTIEDRRIARVFPSSYVLDKNGMIIFAHQGPVEDWREYIPFFEDAVTHSGQD